MPKESFLVQNFHGIVVMKKGIMLRWIKLRKLASQEDEVKRAKLRGKKLISMSLAQLSQLWYLPSSQLVLCFVYFEVQRSTKLNKIMRCILGDGKVIMKTTSSYASSIPFFCKIVLASIDYLLSQTVKQPNIYIFLIKMHGKYKILDSHSHKG